MKQLPLVFLGENEVLVNLFFFFSLSNRDVNSSSELVDSSSLEGAEKVRLGEASDVRVLWGGREKGDGTGGKGSDGELSSLSDSRVLFLLAFGGGLGFEWRVLHVLLTTILSSSSLSLTKTGESHWDSGLLGGGLAAGVLLFLGTRERKHHNYTHLVLSWVSLRYNISTNNHSKGHTFKR